MMKQILILAILVVIITATEVRGQVKPYQEFTLELGLSNRIFFQPGLYEGQKQLYTSMLMQPEYDLEWKNGTQGIHFAGFVRLDLHDDSRTHLDIREFYYQKVFNSSEISVGLKKVYWGVTESVHLVDIINQADLVERFDGEQKLGQPMIHYSWLSHIGTFDFFYMPYFRARVFPGDKGRFRTPFILNSDRFKYESSAKEWNQDFAIRWSHYWGMFDFGLSYFYGTGREPIVNSIQEFNPVWGIINQVGLDLQATIGPVLWKFEGIVRKSQLQDMMGFTGGLEYTFGNVNNSGLDIGLLGEYIYDNRNDLALSGLQSDAFTGIRISFNDTQDTQILAGAIIDVNRSTKLYNIEASRRIRNSWRINLNTRLFQSVSDREFIYFIRNDSFFEFTVSRFF
jgi:hypothetical protein